MEAASTYELALTNYQSALRHFRGAKSLSRMLWKPPVAKLQDTVVRPEGQGPAGIEG
jgi:hypothetical protein